jgi:two-component system, NarL family, nitrate/nitrite response regulator NarL
LRSRLIEERKKMATQYASGGAGLRVAVIDAHPLFRAGVIHTLAIAGDCEVVAEGAGQHDAFRIAAEHAPNLLLLDLHSDFSVEVVRRLATEFPAMRTMIFTVMADGDQVVEALRAGAAGYMLKGASGAELVESVHRVHRGELYVDPSLGAALLGRPVRVDAKADRFSTLTTREDQVLDWLTCGLSNKEIARKADLSEKTVKHYVSQIFDKLEVRNRVEAALLGHKRFDGVPALAH